VYTLLLDKTTNLPFIIRVFDTHPLYDTTPYDLQLGNYQVVSGVSFPFIQRYLYLGRCGRQLEQLIYSQNIVPSCQPLCHRYQRTQLSQQDILIPCPRFAHPQFHSQQDSPVAYYNREHQSRRIPTPQYLSLMSRKYPTSTCTVDPTLKPVQHHCDRSRTLSAPAHLRGHCI